MEKVEKSKLAVWFRRNIDGLLLALPLPRVNPDYVSVLSLIFSIVFIFIESLGFQVLVLSIVILLDWSDGVISKKYKYRKDETDVLKGWMIDCYVDRLSEGIIFLVYFVPFYFLFSLNSFLTLRSFKTGNHLILPLRHILLIYLIIKLIFNL